VRVALVTAHYPPLLSGHADYCELLAHALIDEGLDVEVVVLGSTSATGEGRRTPDGIKVSSGPLPASLSDLVKAVDAISATNPDVVLLQFEAHAFMLKWMPHLLPAAIRHRGLRVVMTYHELWKPGRFGHLPKAILLNTADRVVTFSRWHAAGVSRFRHVGPSPDIVACGSNITKVVSADRQLLRARYDIGVDAVVFTSFGFIMADHCTNELIRSVANLRSEGIDARLQVIGRFDPATDGYHQHLTQTCREFELNDAITWHGRVVDELAVARLIGLSDIGVLPYSSGVGENNGAFAAFAHYGLPTVTTSGDRSVAMEQEAIALFAEPTEQGLTDAMRTLATDAEQRILLAKTVKEWSLRRTWKVVGTTYAALLATNPDPVEVT